MTSKENSSIQSSDTVANDNDKHEILTALVETKDEAEPLTTISQQEDCEPNIVLSTEISPGSVISELELNSMNENNGSVAKEQCTLNTNESTESVVEPNPTDFDNLDSTDHDESVELRLSDRTSDTNNSQNLQIEVDFEKSSDHDSEQSQNGVAHLDTQENKAENDSEESNVTKIENSLENMMQLSQENTNYFQENNSLTDSSATIETKIQIISSKSDESNYNQSASIENNNSIANTSEVLNDEELLDILEGNDYKKSPKNNLDKDDSSATNNKAEVTAKALEQIASLQAKKRKVKRKEEAEKGENKNDLIKDIVDEWCDEDGSDSINKKEEVITNTLPTKRASRVIKKKVIYDPDNPPTFTSPLKTKTESATEGSPSKKQKPEIKNIENQKVKTPMQWKKPQTKKKTTPKDSKKKRITELDRLLMDEGAVNMIYQVENSSSEDTKTNKNMKSKADFIKKSVINQSAASNLTPIKFRERRTLKTNEEPIKKGISAKSKTKGAILGSSSSVGDDYNVTDSIIYRRHSSSSYSSSCLSPRRLSDIELNRQEETQKAEILESNDSFNDIFTPQKEIVKGKHKSPINKNSCLTIKEKLNSKLSKGLKRKSDLMKQPCDMIKRRFSLVPLTKVTLKIDSQLATMTLQGDSNEETIYDYSLILEITSAFMQIENDDQVTAIIIRSNCGNICSGLTMKRDVQSKFDKQLVSELAKAIRNLLQVLNDSKKLICGLVSGICQETGVSIIKLCDIVLASRNAEFNLNLKAQPGMSLFGSNRLLKEAILLGKKISAAEALEHGLVTKILENDAFEKDANIYCQELTNISGINNKKRLLNIWDRRRFEENIEAETAQVIEYWCSPENDQKVKIETKE